MTVYNNDDIMNAVESVENYISQLSTKITGLEQTLERMNQKIDLIQEREFTRKHWQQPNPSDPDPLMLAMASDNIIKLDEDATPVLITDGIFKEMR